MIEITTFRLAPGADEGAFLEADRLVQTEFAYQQPGLLRRTTAKSEDGEWIVIDIWQSGADADACNDVWEQDETTRNFMSFLDRSTMSTSRYTELG